MVLLYPALAVFLLVFIAYPMIDLRRAGYFVKEYVYRIEEAVIRTLAHFGVTGHRIGGAPGIYVRPAPGVPEAFHNIGIRIEDDAVVTQDGVAFSGRAGGLARSWPRGRRHFLVFQSQPWSILLCRCATRRGICRST